MCTGPAIYTKVEKSEGMVCLTMRLNSILTDIGRYQQQISVTRSGEMDAGIPLGE